MCRECLHDAALAARCNERRAELVRGQYLFSGLSDRQLEAVFGAMNAVDVEAEQWLYLQNEPAECFFLVEEGEVALLRHSSDGDEVIVAIVGPGETFADEVLFLEEPRHSVSCRALTPACVISFDRRQFSGLLDSSPQLARKVMATLHRRNQMLLDELEQKTLHSATERLVSFLASEAQGDLCSQRISLSYPKKVLASRLSIKPETLSRILAKLRECSLVEMDGSDIVLNQSTVQREGLSCESCCRRFWGCPGARARAEQAASATPRASGRSPLPVLSSPKA
ncbi:MAG: Crp/Fnr family transcriptional regulator [Acidobacteriota bacterium]|nr:Crp/Fnr family transcriptional regulator [Acidobacteriota bacterium]